MAISSLHGRAALALLAAAAAVLALSMHAGASTGTPLISPEQAGYNATGAQFKTIDARVFLRQPTQYASEVASFGSSVQLWSPGLVISVGLTASTSGGGYTTYATIYDRSTHQVIASNPNAQHCCAQGDCCFPGPVTWDPGVKASLRISYTPADGQLLMIEGPGDGSDFAFNLHGCTAGLQPGPGRHRVRQLAVGRVLPAHPAGQIPEDRRLQPCGSD